MGGNVSKLKAGADDNMEAIQTVGKRTADGGEIFNDYEDNKALSVHSSASGSNCIAGGKGFKIVAQNAGTGENSYTFAYMQNNGDGTVVCYCSAAPPVSIGMKVTLSVANVYNDVVVEDNTGGGGLNITLSGVPADAEMGGDNAIILNEGTEGVGTYTLSSVEGLEVGMTYSVRLSFANYNAGTITAINGTDVTVDGYTYIEPYTEEEIAEATSEFFRANYLTIVGRPDLGDMDVGYNAVSMGENCIAQDSGAFSGGYNNKSIGLYSTTFGRDNIAGYGSLVNGRGNEGNGTANIVSGQTNIVDGSYNEVSGMNNKVINHGGKNEVSGGDNTVDGDYNSVNGQLNTVTGNRNDIAGYGNTITTNLASARGSNNTVTAENGDAQGTHTVVSGYAGHSEGGKAQSNGNYSHARNYNTKANGARSTAGGFNSEANGDTSTSVGKATIANGDNQTVIGTYNKADTTSAFIVGNGISTERSNAFALDWDGNGTFAGDVMINGETSIDNMNETLTLLSSKTYEGIDGETVAVTVKDGGFGSRTETYELAPGKSVKINVDDGDISHIVTTNIEESEDASGYLFYVEWYDESGIYISDNAYFTNNPLTAIDKNDDGSIHSGALLNAKSYMIIAGSSYETQTITIAVETEPNTIAAEIKDGSITTNKLSSDVTDTIDDLKNDLANAVGGTYTVKRHVGDTVPTGTSVILKYMHTPLGDVTVSGNQQGDRLDVITPAGITVMIMNASQASSDSQGGSIKSISANTFSYKCSSYEEDCYAVFEVTIEGSVTEAINNIPAKAITSSEYQCTSYIIGNGITVDYVDDALAVNCGRANGSRSFGANNSSANGEDASAFGESRANAQYSASFGTSIASGSTQVTLGKTNIEDTNNEFAVIVGNGSSETPSNAYTLDWDGNGTFAGEVYDKDGKLMNETAVSDMIKSAVGVALEGDY